ncbi:FAD-dependent oxidoreductase [Parabacteroides sp. Marseille-P3160]|uniref:FAD-dependent oxidoreductase n=1 Tax=Parabacteroides sp. Marseille-P3160 TaxID=1917887 RepID=UPI0009BC1F18|nr:FAD-dependent oxidoreductase [Parabacteroides sp. Marseille-P3160]
MRRRTMLKTVGAISLSSVIPKVSIASPVEYKEIRKEIETEVLIVGGGTAGTIAAIQAARAGCNTILVENGSQLGGTTTTGGVAFPGLFHAWGKQIIAGIGWELISDTIQLGDGTFPDFNIPTRRAHWKHQIRLNPYLYALLSEEKCQEAGVQIRYYETPTQATWENGRWNVKTVGKGTHTHIRAKQLIDCTGNGFVTALSGFKVLREDEIQPGTLQFKIGEYDIDKLDMKLIQAKYEEAIKKKEISQTEFRSIAALLQNQGDNIQHILGADSTTSETHTIANIKGRSSLLKMLRFLRTLPGCEKTKLVSMQPETAVRETYRIDGEYQITHEDYVNGKVFEDSLSYSFYPIDLHDEQGVVPKHLNEHKVATVPLRALIPKNSQNLLVAGRCVSSDRLANSALRVQASCMGMGQAAGAAAALACKQNVTPLKVIPEDIRKLLQKHNAIVPGENL